MIKRIFDVLNSFVAIICLTPLWAIMGLLIKTTSKGPIFFKQIRIGKNECEFEIFKFRTMVVDAEKKGLQITVGGRDPRVTSIGYYLRKYKIDELPQLFNVLSGTMSFVGPRPEVPKYVNMYTVEQKKVFSVRPGITDLASIHFRDENELLKDTSDPEGTYINEIMPSKLLLNLEYIEKKSFLFDLKLIFLTLKSIIK